MISRKGLISTARRFEEVHRRFYRGEKSGQASDQAQYDDTIADEDEEQSLVIPSNP